jgi:hypothetical protein
MKTPNYYHIDCGFFPVQIKLCFNNKDYQSILSDYNVDLKANALEIGVAETHLIPTQQSGIIVLVFNLKECSDDWSELMGFIVHEASHCTNQVFEVIGEDVDNIGDETRAYLIQHLVKQITKGIILEREKHVRKRDRKVSKQKDKRSGGSDVQVDQHSDRSAGSDYYPERKDSSSGAQDSYGGALGTAKVGLFGATIPRAAGYNPTEQE